PCATRQSACDGLSGFCYYVAHDLSGWFDPVSQARTSSAVRRISQNLLMYSGQGRGLKPWRVLTQESGVADELGGSGCGGVFESRPSHSRTTAPDTRFESGSDPVSGRIQRGALCAPLLSEPTTGLTRAAGLAP